MRENESDWNIEGQDNKVDGVWGCEWEATMSGGFDLELWVCESNLGY